MQHQTGNKQPNRLKIILSILVLGLVLLFGKGGLTQLLRDITTESTPSGSSQTLSGGASVETSRVRGDSTIRVGETVNNGNGTENASLDALQHTEIFATHALEHIFYGQINAQGNATGYHHEGFPDTPGAVVEGTRTPEDSNGVYEAKVVVNDIDKSGNDGYSSFFPTDWSAQKVVDAIQDAYLERELVVGNTWSGFAGDMEIHMYLANDKRIISAFPIYED